MKHKLDLVITLFLLACVLLLGGFARSRKAQIKELDKAPDRGEVSWHIRKAKINAGKELILPGWHVCPPSFQDLDDALTQMRVVLAKPIEKYVKSETWSLVTYHKFKIVNELNKRPIQQCGWCDEPEQELANIPDDLLPLETDEVLVPHIGGNLKINGVKVIQPSTVSVDFATGTDFP